MVQRTIKVVLIVARHITCHTGPLLCGLKKSIKLLSVFCPVDFNGRVRQSSFVVASDSEGCMVGV